MKLPIHYRSLFKYLHNHSLNRAFHAYVKPISTIALLRNAVETASGNKVYSRYSSIHINDGIIPQRSTIFALSSGRGKCGVAIFRVSGSQAWKALSAVAKLKENIVPRKVYLRKLYHPKTDEQIDHGLVVWFPGPQSFTGEDCCEFHVHGGSSVSAGLVDALASIPGLRYAEAGEFTKRAFENGKLDLTQVEGLSDLLNAETSKQRTQALKQFSGAQRTLYTKWKQTLLQCTAHVEAYIDFSEEEQIEDDVLANVRSQILRLQLEIKQHVQDDRCSERIRSGVSIAIVGQPNAGKSSLLNLLCERNAAIVSPQAGTTRDVIEVCLDISGFPVNICDTAGLRRTSDAVEVEGVKRALNRADEADVLVLLLDTSQSDVRRSLSIAASLNDAVFNHMRELGLAPSVLREYQSHNGEEFKRNEGQQLIAVLNKVDLLTDDERREYIELISTSKSQHHRCCLASCQSENGIKHVQLILQQTVTNLCTTSSKDSIGVAQARHRHHLMSCLNHLTVFINEHNNDVVLAAQDLRHAIYQIGKIMGHVTSEDILDVIFRDFCIGK